MEMTLVVLKAAEEKRERERRKLFLYRDGGRQMLWTPDRL